MNDRRIEGFSYPVRVGHVSSNPVTVRISASDAERTALARIWGVTAVGELEAEIVLTPWKRDGVRARGEVRGRVTQPSVVSLEPVESIIDAPVDAVFVPDGSRLSRVERTDTGEVIVDPEGPDMPETFSGDTLDVGAVVAEFAALSIDPYPRLPDEVFEADDGAGDEAFERPSPFASLKDWRGGKE